MTLPFDLGTVPLPDWVPWWLPVLVLIPAVIYALMLLAVPFSVFGTRGRLRDIEARLDDLHAEIRMLALRLPEPVVGDLPPIRARPARASDPYDDGTRRDRTTDPQADRTVFGRRAEPRFD